MAKKEDVLIEDDDILDNEGTSNENDDEEYVAVEEAPETEESDDSDDEEEKSLKADDEDEEDREAIRERRRLEKKERKDRREKAIGRDKTELNFLRQRNDELERRLMAIESFTQKSTVNDIDRQLNEAIREAELADQVIAKAVEAGNGEDVTKALRYRDQAISRAQQLYGEKQRTEATANTPRETGMPREVQHFVKEFMSENTWYDPSGKDEDSAIVLAIDNKLAEEGYDPRTEEYWDELQERVKRRLPEKFEEAAPRAKRKPTGGPAVGSGREHAPTSTRKEIYISPERKAALVEMGVWDDPVLRQRYIKRYAEYDRMNKSS